MEDRKHGEGVLRMKNGLIYDGQWSRDQVPLQDAGARFAHFGIPQRDGHGKQNNPDGSLYDGTWKDNTYNGEGVLTYPCGSTYTGPFVLARGY